MDSRITENYRFDRFRLFPVTEINHSPYRRGYGFRLQIPVTGSGGRHD